METRCVTPTADKDGDKKMNTNTTKQSAESKVNFLDFLDDLLATGEITQRQLDSALRGLELFADKHTALSSEADIDYIEVDGDCLNFGIDANYSIVNVGIGAYEYWGQKCRDDRYEPELNDDYAFDLDFDDSVVEPYGLSTTFSADEDPSFGDPDEDDYGRSYDYGIAHGVSYLYFWVDDPAKARSLIPVLISLAEAENAKKAASKSAA